MNISAIHTPQSDTDTDGSQSDDHVIWSPGDGVCPSTAQFNHCWESKFDEWKDAACTHPERSDSFAFYIKAFLNLLENVPPLFDCPPKGVNITGGPRSFLILKSCLRIKSTIDPSCDHFQKSIDYLQCLGSSKPIFYNPNVETNSQVAVPITGKPLRSGYFTNIVLAWSYIISCRWVEILQRAGEQSQIQHEDDKHIDDSFWDLVTQSSWVAQVKKHRGVFYSPWMLRKEAITNEGNWVPVSPNSFLAFDRLLHFCLSEGLEGELLTGLASVLISTSRNVPPPRYASPLVGLDAFDSSSPRQRDTIFHELFQSIDKCIFLSATQDAMDSLLCSAFFDPCVPCNLAGAASLGVKKSISALDKIDHGKLLNAITYNKPHLSLLWAAAICNEQATSFLDMALCHLPPICLAAGFWTNTIQSFLQVAYCSESLQEHVISRAAEFKTSFYCRPDIPVPWSPVPPFGTTTVENLSLEIRTHLLHKHRPISWTIDWILSSGERVQASKQYQLELVDVGSMYHSEILGEVNDSPCLERNTAEEQSWSATSRLFNWHRDYDDGLWLDNGKGDMEVIRQLQMHPWIIDQFDSHDDDPVDEPRLREPCNESILRWVGEVERHQ